MIRGQQIYLISQTSINEMLLSNITPAYTQFSQISVNSKSLLSLKFAVKYLNHKTPNDIRMKHFLSGNTQDKMNVFDGSKIDFFVKIYTH